MREVAAGLGILTFIVALALGMFAVAYEIESRYEPAPTVTLPPIQSTAHCREVARYALGNAQQDSVMITLICEEEEHAP